MDPRELELSDPDDRAAAPDLAAAASDCAAAAAAAAFLDCAAAAAAFIIPSVPYVSAKPLGNLFSKRRSCIQA